MGVKQDTWVWVVVQDPDNEEKILGLHDDEKKVSFIPAFLDRDEAQKCLGRLATEKGKKYEIQAIRYGFLVRHSNENGFMIFILNGEGEVFEKIEPGGLTVNKSDIE